MRKKRIPIRSASCQPCGDKDGGIFFRYPERLIEDKNSKSSLLFIKYYSKPKKTSFKIREEIIRKGEIENKKDRFLTATNNESKLGESREFNGSIIDAKRRICSSCRTSKTPYWREGWEFGILLCNACGIRYQKYRRYCGECCTIARKDETGKLHCPNCHIRL
jgi:hypothetical protein